jgi:myotubularin-related protein 5/13
MFSYMTFARRHMCFISGGRLAGSSAGPNLGQSVFDYIEKQNARSTLFYNFMYTPDTEHPVRFQLLYNLCKELTSY